ncbi:hypothetical protein J3A83DRAFT_4114304 [Scleroderma citrinum]
MSSNGAWDKQVRIHVFITVIQPFHTSQIPEGAILCGVILFSDKTNIMNMCGGRVVHPLLISLANIKMAV